MTLALPENTRPVTRDASRINSVSPLAEYVSKQLTRALSRRNLSAAEVERIGVLAAKARFAFQLCITSKLETQSVDALSEMHEDLLGPYIPEFSELEISRKDYDWMKSEVRRCLKSALQTASA